MDADTLVWKRNTCIPNVDIFKQSTLNMTYINATCYENSRGRIKNIVFYDNDNCLETIITK